MENEKLIEEARALDAKLSPGPWIACDYHQDDGPNKTTVARTYQDDNPKSIWPDGIVHHAVLMATSDEEGLKNAAGIAELRGLLPKLATALAAATTENTQLRSAINRAGFGVMKTSGDWLICDVSKAGEAEREKTAEIIIRNIELEKEIAAATERELGMREAMSGAVRMLHAAGYKMEGTISDKIRESFPELFTKDNK